MIQAFAGKAKAIALIFLSLFYSQFVLSNYSILLANKVESTHFNTHYFSKDILVAHTQPGKYFPVITSPEAIVIPSKKVINSKAHNLKNLKLNTSGPTQPEMQSFQAVNNSNMVDLFTGDFSYNIPLLDVGGYPVNIFYRSGITMDDEASWVGLGWNINPGTITRNVRGIPDDFNGKTDTMTKITSILDNLTVGASIGGSLELKGFPILNASASVGAFYNNYSGWGIENNINASISSGTGSAGTLTGGLSLNNSSRDGLTIKPSLDVTLFQLAAKENATASGSFSIGSSYNSRSGLKSLEMSTGLRLYKHSIIDQSFNPLSSSISFASPSYTPTITVPYTNYSYTLTFKPGGEFFAAHPNVFLSGYVSKQGIAVTDRKRTIPAYGYLNFQNAVNIGDALLDFNREKEVVYREKPELPNIAVPSYTYDIFSISGEGTGGMFRPYRSDIGYINDHVSTTKDMSGALSLDIGAGNLVHAGVDFNINSSKTSSGAWIADNQLAKTVAFKKSDSTFESVYFKNPSEKTVTPKDFYTAVGDDDVVTASLYQNGLSPTTLATNYLHRYRGKNFVGDALLTPQNSYKKQRDKRSQVISYLTADEASKVGLDRKISNYALNQWGSAPCATIISKEDRINSFRKANHISEIDVLNNDGRRYIYGLPVYNLSQKEVSYSIGTGDKAAGLGDYNTADASTDNSQGKEHYYNAELTPSYAHTFLLTGVLSPDYIDLTGDGVSDDDPGDAIKFNYSKVASSTKPFSWRAPNLPGKVTYNESLQTYSRDDKGSYIYGQKELWYLNTIESKNMVAVFIVENRADINSVLENGNLQTDTISKRLKEIRLYTKSDFVKNGAKAVSIKTVHFEYAYDLCKGINGITNQGKLTLKRIWFTYNGNDKGIKNPYAFNYTGNNPTYNTYSNDRWGNYKNTAANTKGGNQISNADYPYAVQDSVTAAYNASAWTLDSIKIPSGGRIKVSYESDDYAFVQNKRAMQMFNVVGLSRAKPTTLYATAGSGNLTNVLYDKSISVDNNPDNLYVGIRVSMPVINNQDLYQKYLEGINKIYFKLKVQMPTDMWGSGYEYVPCYADIDNTVSEYYGYLSGNTTVIWVKLKGISLQGDADGNYSPLAKGAIQFLRMNLPSKAYPGSEIGSNISPTSAIKVIGALGTNLIKSFESFDRIARQNNWAYQIDTNRTIVRLNTPTYKKYGGGLRVKSIIMYDNWHLMTTQKEATYGQTYTYTTSKNINGSITTISSGVASYEPMLGGEENPWRQPLEYTEKLSPLAPVTLGYSEEPLGETFFPSPSIGYSDVQVRTIHADGIKSATGLEETKFYTSYDFPTLVDHSMLSPENVKRYKSPLSNFLRINSRHYLNMSQGFKIELNDMNGKMRSQATFSEANFTTPISYIENFYKVDDKNAELKHLNNTTSTISATGLIDTTSSIGKDVELMMDMREQSTITIGANVNIDLDAFVVFLVPILLTSVLPLPQYEENRFRSIATTKVIQRYGILDSIVVIDKGSKISTENLLYDSETGDPLLTRTKNEFNDTLYNFQYPAHWAYSGMSMAYKNIAASFSSENNSNIIIAKGILSSSGKYPNLLNNFESGDEILATGREAIKIDTPFNCNGVQSGCISIQYSPATFTAKKIWAVDARKIDTASPVGIFFLDSAGNPYSATAVTMKIVRSGKRNMGSTPIGTITCLKNPVKFVSGESRLVIDSTVQILNTSAAAYKDLWKVKDYLYLKDSAVTEIQNTSIILNPLNATTFVEYKDNGSPTYTKYSNSNNILTGFEYHDNYSGLSGCHTKYYSYKTALNFNFSGVPYQSHIVSATISFTNKIPSDFNYHSGDCNENFNFTTSTASYSGVSASYLKRITGAWNSTTTYNNLSATDTNESTVVYTNTQSSPANCTNLIQDIVDTSQQYGLLFQIQKNSFSIDGQNETNYLNFCANNGSGCYAPALNITYAQPVVNHYYVCRSPITQRSVNPYMYGIFGNWRVDKAYVYYGDRRENNLTDSTNIRTNGAIKNYTSYWSFLNNKLKATTDTTNWIWNTQTTMYNRKGLELENKDPLGRYNSGQYGYNESLPISVTQNSLYQEQFFDGFEDYSYSSQNCFVNCTLPRDVDFTKYGGVLIDSVKHSGNYSLRVKADTTINIPISLSAPLQPSLNPLKVSIDTLNFKDTSVTSTGNGQFTVGYGYIGQCIGNPTSYTTRLEPDTSGLYQIVMSNINCTQCASGSQNKLIFTLTGFGLNIYDTVIANTTDFSITVTLGAGNVYDLAVFSVPDANQCYMNNRPTFSWKRLSNCAYGQQLVQIPNRYIYSGNITTGVTSYQSHQCTQVNGIYGYNSILLPGFSIFDSKKYIFSCWVREDRDCSCDTFDLNQVKFIFTDSSNNSVSRTLKPSGNIIEGWQRYEDTVTVPFNAAAMKLSLQATGSSNVFFDDIRILPYNATMKSFVYNPLTLRLMAELDENNYTTFYEYDNDGTLIRLKKETERGIKTIKETRSSLSTQSDQ